MKHRIILFVALGIVSYLGAETKKYTQDQIEEGIAQGKAFSFKASKNDVGIKVTLANGEIVFAGVEAKSKEVKSAQKSYEKLLKRKTSLSQFCMGRSLHMSSGRDMTADGTNYEAQQSIFLSAGQAIALKNTIMNSPEIQLEGRVLTAATCLIMNPKSFIIKGKNNSILKLITVTFVPNKTIQCGLEGTLDLDEGTTENQFIIFGALEVSVTFAAPHAVEDNEDEDAA